MSEKNYKDVLDKGGDISAKVQAQRETLKNEFKKLGDAYAEFIKEKFNIRMTAEVSGVPLSPTLASAGFVDSGIVMLTLSAEVAKEKKIVVLTCAFAEGGAYPCEIDTETEPKICKTFTAVQSALADICKTKSVNIYQEAERIKAVIEKEGINSLPMTNESPVPNDDAGNVSGPL